MFNKLTRLMLLVARSCPQLLNKRRATVVPVPVAPSLRLLPMPPSSAAAEEDLAEAAYWAEWDARGADVQY